MPDDDPLKNDPLLLQLYAIADGKTLVASPDD
jgi:hypothetical protein